LSIRYDGGATRTIPDSLTGGGTFTSDRPVGRHKLTAGIDVDMLQITDVTVFKARVSFIFGDLISIP